MLVLRRKLSPFAYSVAALIAATGITFAIAPFAPNISLGGVYLLAVLPVSASFGLAYGIPVSIVGVAAYAWFFLPPVHHISVNEWQNWVALATYLATAIVASELAALFRRRVALAEQRTSEAGLLASVSSILLQAPDVAGQGPRIAPAIAAALGIPSVRIALGDADSSGDSVVPLTAAGRTVGSLAFDEPPNSDLLGRIVPSLASLLAMAVDREKLAHEALAAEALRRADAVKTAVLRAVSHDLQSPLTAIRVAAEGIRNNPSTLGTIDRSTLLDSIIDETTRLERLVRNLLDLSRLEADAASPDRQLHGVDELLESSLRALDSETARPRFRVTLPAEVPYVSVDETQIERTLVNVLDNAAKFSSDEEPVDVVVESDKVTVSIAVRDRGRGIERGELHKIFEPFHRGSNAAGVQGSGLGLAIARGFASSNGGALRVASSGGSGSVFTLVLPRVDPTAEELD